MEFAPTSFWDIISLQCYVSAKIDFYLLKKFKKFLRNYSKRPQVQNKGNMTLKNIRFWQIETKSLMGKGLSSLLLVSLQKSEYILSWINKVWIKASNGQKRWSNMSVEELKEAYNLHFPVTPVRAAALSHLSFFNSTSCSAITA